MGGDQLPLVAPDQAEAARHGSFCPKMCSFACPVTAATGRDDAVPWSFHRTVSDLHEGRLEPSVAAFDRLTACTGCLSCREPCLFDQDVPAQVRAGREALHRRGVAPPVVGATAARVARAESPYPAVAVRAAPATASDDGAAEAATTVTVVPGCRDDAPLVEAALRLLRAAGEHPVLARPPGCCGAALRDLGAADEADDACSALSASLPTGSARVVALDPHCLEELRSAVGEEVAVAHVVDELHRLVEEGRLMLERRLGPITYHDPCLLARGERVTEQPRELLRAAGATIVEPESHAAATACSGAGLGLELLDAGAAEATARLRRRSLDTGATVVTACAGARRRLSTATTPVTDLIATLADCLPEVHP